MKKTLLILTLLMSAFCTTMAKGEDIIVKVDKNGKATGCKSFSVNNGYFTIDNIDYDIVDDHLEVSLCDDEDVKGNAHIIAALVYEGKRYNVTTISEWAFEDCEYLTSIYNPTRSYHNRRRSIQEMHKTKICTLSKHNRLYWRKCHVAALPIDI